MQNFFFFGNLNIEATIENFRKLIFHRIKWSDLRNLLQGLDIGIISPYRAQVDLLKSMMPEVSVSTCDTFQGEEKTAILVSMTRNNTVSRFLTDAHRLNMTITRAAKHIAIFGNIEILKQNPTWSSLVALHTNSVIDYHKFEQLCAEM